MNIVTLVMEGVKDQLLEWSLSDDGNMQGHAKDCNAALMLWQKQTQPLGYMDNAYSHLVRAINNNPATLGQGLLGLLPWTTIIFLVCWAMSRCCCLSWDSDCATVLENQSFICCLQDGHQRGRKSLGCHVDDPANCTALIDLITKVASLAKICNVSWSPNPTHVTGRSITIATHATWINLGQPNVISQILHSNPQCVALETATQCALAHDTQAEWSTLEILIQNLYTTLNRYVLPEEWDHNPMSWRSGVDSSYVHQRNIYIPGSKIPLMA